MFIMISFKRKKIIATEYGETVRKPVVAQCVDPIAAYPVIWHLTDLLFYANRKLCFQKKYRHGKFIAFHGSWNRAPEKQKGYFVVFQPFKNGKPDGNWGGLRR